MKTIYQPVKTKLNEDKKVDPIPNLTISMEVAEKLNGAALGSNSDEGRNITMDPRASNNPLDDPTEFPHQTATAVSNDYQDVVSKSPEHPVPLGQSGLKHEERPRSFIGERVSSVYNHTESLDEPRPFVAYHSTADYSHHQAPPLTRSNGSHYRNIGSRRFDQCHYAHSHYPPQYYHSERNLRQPPPNNELYHQHQQSIKNGHHYVWHNEATTNNTCEDSRDMIHRFNCPYGPSAPSPKEEQKSYTTVYKLNSNDVLSGRGGGTNNFIGNRNFRKVIKENKEKYILLSRKEKSRLVFDIVKKIRARGGRFLVKDSEVSKGWRDIGDDKARDKTSQALREGRPKLLDEMYRRKNNLKTIVEQEQGQKSSSAFTRSEDCKIPKRKAVSSRNADHNQIKRPRPKKEEDSVNNTRIGTEAEEDWDGVTNLGKKITVAQPLPLFAVSRVHI